MLFLTDQMKEILLELSQSSLPKYRRMADAIRGAIKEGRLRRAKSCRLLVSSRADFPATVIP